MKNHFRNLFSNPLSFSLLLFLVAVGLFFLVSAKFFIEIVDGVLSGVAGSLIVAAIFAIIYEYFSREKVISQAVESAVGQSKASALGIRDIVDEVGMIDHKSIIRNSETLRISSRYSAILLHGLRSEIYKRLKAGKRLDFLRMRDAQNVPHGRGPEGTPDTFFQTLAATDPQLLERVAVSQVDRLFSYNFVESDAGIWIKLYLNAGTPEAPPAFFVEQGSLLYDTYKKDIDCLFGMAEKIEIKNVS